MSNRVEEALPIDKCTFCKGRMVSTTTARGTTTRCATCGREPVTLAGVLSPLPSSNGNGGGHTNVRVGDSPTGRPCPVEGCPGVLGPSGNCGCCQRREAWLIEHRPVIECEMCHGHLARVEKNRGRQRRFCDACSAVRAQVPNLGTKLGPRKKP